MTHFRILAALVIWATTCLTWASPAVALFYGKQAHLHEFRIFDVVVVEPDHGHDPKAYARPDSRLFAYVSVAEAHPGRSYFKDIPDAWKIAHNGDWGSEVIDQTPEAWPEFFASRVVAPLWEKGFRGFFLDTLDSYRLARNFDEAEQQRGLIRVIETLHRRFPGIQLILNRGFEIVPQVRDKVFMVAAESLYQGWNANSQRYEPVRENDRKWLLGQLQAIRELHGIEILVIDYVAPGQRTLSRETARRIGAHGFTPWVTDSKLESMGIGSVESVPRRIMMLYDSSESAALKFSNAHRYLQMPLNHLGYVVDYADVRKPLPAVAPDRYAGVVSWLSGGLPAPYDAALNRWLQARQEDKLPIAIIGELGFVADRKFERRFNLEAAPARPAGALKIVHQHPIMGFETSPRPHPGEAPPVRAIGEGAEPLIELRDARDERYTGGALMPWGGFILEPFALYKVPGNDQLRWVIDPFAFIQASLRLPDIPVADVTTENGRRLLFSHIDGDGFPSLAEFPGAPTAAEVLLDKVLLKYRIPTTVSVIESETSPNGLHPKLSSRLEEAARKMFRLPHVEVASHTYSHPFLWDISARHGKFKDDREETYHLDIPGYHFDLHREIVGSMNYIRQRLAPAGKPARILLWSGDTSPGADALKIVTEAGFLNMNGGDTSISRSNPSLTAVGALGVQTGGFLQVYAPITNENIYTNLWRGPFYGFERVIETFEMTEHPRRLKPVDIYYHTYSASKPAALKALDKVFAWADRQTLHPVFASEYIAKVHDFHTLAIGRDDKGWRIRSDGHLRTLRIPGNWQPRVDDSDGIAGYLKNGGTTYVHLAGESAQLSVKNEAGAKHPPYLVDANARIGGWAPSTKRKSGTLSFTLKGHQALDLRLANVIGCQTLINGKPAVTTRSDVIDGTPVSRFKSNDATAQIEISCAGR